jgi:predicted secreted protein
VAIFTLFWVLSAFLVMPFGLRTIEEEGHERVAGQVDSAPAQFRPGRIALRATILAAVLFGLFYANYVYGWIGVENLNLFGKPPQGQG